MREIDAQRTCHQLCYQVIPARITGTCLAAIHDKIERIRVWLNAGNVLLGERVSQGVGKEMKVAR